MMGGGLPEMSVRRPWLAIVLNLLIIIAGVAALRGVEVRELPNVDRPIVSVRANFPGAAPETVDAEATRLVEAAVARVSGVVAVRSSSEENNFRLRVEFDPSVDLADAANDVREAVSRVERNLPDAVENLFVIKADADAQPIVEIAVASATASIDALTRVVEDEITPRLTSVDGVADVTLFGARERVLYVRVDPARLASFALTVADVAAALRLANFDAPVGSFASDQQEVLVRADATVARVAEIARLALRDPIRLGDVADVYFGPAEATSVARVDGREAVTLRIVRQAGANTVEIAAQVRAEIDRLVERFPDLTFTVIADDSVYVEGAVKEVLISMLLATAIVSLVVFAFLGRLGATLAPILAMPTALIGAVAAIWLFGFSLNLITLLALVLATGLVADDAIVVLENIERRAREGERPRAAAVLGARQVFFAVIATTATLIAVFIPISFLPSTAGRLFREFGVVLSVAVALSSFVALTLCPLVASRFVGGAGGPRRAGFLATGLGALYRAALGPMLRAPLVALTGFCLIAAAAGLSYSALKQELTPPEDRGVVSVRMQAPDGAGLDFMDRQVVRAERQFERFLESGVAVSIYSVTGWFDPNRGSVRVQLAPWDDRAVSQQEIQNAVRGRLRAIPGAPARVTAGNSLGVRSFASGVNFALTGDNYAEIAAAAEAFALVLEREMPELERVSVEYQATQPQIALRIDRERASDLGVSLEALSETLQAVVDESEIAELVLGDRAIPIVLRSTVGAVRDPSDLLNLTVRAETGRLVSLSQLVTFSEAGVAAELDRHGQRRAVEIRTDPSPALPLSEAVAQIRALAAEQLPDDVGLLFLGEAASFEETSNDLAWTFAVALLVAFLVLVAQFESVVSALVVMVTVPFGVCAAVFALWLMDVSLNIYSQIGVLLLIGVMAKNSILLVEFADQLRDRGLSPLEAAREGASARLRPITMTILSTVLAGLPLVFGSGPGAEARAAIGSVVFGGLGLAAVFTLFLTPTVYALIAGWAAPRGRAAAELDAELLALDAAAPRGREPGSGGSRIA